MLRDGVAAAVFPKPWSRGFERGACSIAAESAVPTAGELVQVRYSIAEDNDRS
jgi:hypothetical protein